ncbi:uncharacterized protein LOC127854638 [Dreissena polymorpha]|uniref:uncharacterized protein LOC127854638 n=1 Tax=Dreissena polymorpha TaxID=45954 RepID=UPI002263DE0C|nr:uncharacterized protein LOC127854638 [Dreissena polymorpha]
METATPVKSVRACLTCNRSSQGHLKNLRNVAMRSILLKKQFECLGCNIEDLVKVVHENLLVCDTCLKILDKLSEMKLNLQMNMKELKKSEDRTKRLIMHSVSPVVKKFKDTTVPVKSRKSSRALFKMPSPSPSRCIDSVISPKSGSIDHSYSGIPSKTKTQSLDHLYSTTVNQNVDLNNPYSFHKKKILMPPEITVNEKKSVITIFEQSSKDTVSVNTVLEKLLDLPSVNERLYLCLLQRLSGELNRICGTKDKSVLRTKVSELEPETFFSDIVKEMHLKCPKVLQFLITLSCPMDLAVPEKKHGIAAMYALGMYLRNNHMIAFQKAVAASCIRYNAGNGLMEFLHNLGMSIPTKSKLPMLDDLGQINGRDVVSALAIGKTIKITVDNIDGHIKAYQVRLGSGNRDFHYTHWSILIDRFDPRDLQGLSTQPKQITAQGPDPTIFFLSSNEHEALRKRCTQLVMRILVEEIQPLSMFSTATPRLVDHKYKQVVDRPSQVHSMFVIMKDPKSLPNCVQIMDTILGTIESLYTPAGRGI